MKIRKTILEYLLIIAMGTMSAFSYTLFIIINNFAPAGINGIAVMIQYKLNFSVGFMYLIVNVPLCLFAFFKINKRFAIRSFVYCIVYSFVYLGLQQLDLSRFQYNANGVDTIYPVLLAGLISGIGFGVLFNINACTGGTDIIAKYVSKTRPYMNFFWVGFTMNIIVAAISFFVYGENVNGEIIYNFKPVCLCMVYCFVSSFVGDTMIKGMKSAYRFEIITAQPEELEKEILEKLRHSATVLHGEGIYSGNEKAVLVCVINKHQLVEFKDIVSKYPGTFTVVTPVDETIGNFKKIK